MRKRIYEIVEVSQENDKVSRMYDCFMMVIIIISLVPLVSKQKTVELLWVDRVTVTVFIVDYLLRLLTADYKIGKHRWSSFIRYPFTPMAVIDLLCILPSITIINSGFKVLKVFRLFRSLRVLRAFKAIRYSKNITMVLNVFKKQRESLITVGSLAIVYILISALIVFNAEPDTFNSFFDAVYWATVSLTTVGYGDIYTVTTIGKIVTMCSALFGVAVVALPAGIITAGYMEELTKMKEDREK